MVTETTAGTYSYGLSCTAGSQSKSTQTTVAVSWPALTVSLTASPTTITSGNSTTLTWTSANAKTCAASGGGTDDGWAGTARATTGSAVITEPVVLASPLTLTYTLTCSNSGTSQSTPASVKVVLNPPANSGGGGGGALNPLSLLFLAGAAALRGRRKSGLRISANTGTGQIPEELEEIIELSYCFIGSHGEALRASSPARARDRRRLTLRRAIWTARPSKVELPTNGLTIAFGPC